MIKHCPGVSFQIRKRWRTYADIAIRNIPYSIVYAHCPRSRLRSVTVPYGITMSIVPARLEHRNRWNIEMVLHCENAAIITAIPAATQLLCKS